MCLIAWVTFNSFFILVFFCSCFDFDLSMCCLYYSVLCYLRHATGENRHKIEKSCAISERIIEQNTMVTMKSVSVKMCFIVVHIEFDLFSLTLRASKMSFHFSHFSYYLLHILSPDLIRVHD